MPKMRTNMFGYLKRSLLFFDMKAGAIPPLVFVILLILTPIKNLITGNSERDVVVYYDELVGALYDYSGDISSIPELPANSIITVSAWFLVFLILNDFVTSIYIVGVISDARGTGFSVTDCVLTVFRRIFPLLAASVLYYIAIFLGASLLIIPGIILSIILVFYRCALLCNGKGVISSLRFSAQLTKGRRMDIFLVTLFTGLFLLVIQTLVLIFFSQPKNNAVFSFVSLFLSVVSSLIINKLISILYLDSYALTINNTANAKSTTISVNKFDDLDSSS